MKKLNIFFTILLKVSLNCKSKSNFDNNNSIIDVRNFDLGKINLPYNQIDYLSKVLKINKK